MSSTLKLIGNSHLAMMKSAWSENKDFLQSAFPSVSLEFFGFPNQLADRFTVNQALGRFALRGAADKGERALIKRMNGSAWIGLDADRLCLVGLPNRARLLLKFAISNRVDKVTHDLAEGPRVSLSAFKALCRRTQEQSIPKAFRSKALSGALIVTAPRPAQGFGERLLAESDTPIEPSNIAAAMDVIDETAVSLFDEMGFEVVRQLEDTIAENGLTKDTLNVGSKRIVDNKVREFVDVLHMNSDYGKLMLNEVLARTG